MAKKYVKVFSITRLTGKMPMKTSVKYHILLLRMAKLKNI